VVTKDPTVCRHTPNENAHMGGEVMV